jgi:peroxiredoxin
VGGLLLSARLFLAGVFGLAALTKSRDRAGARQGLANFGVPSFALPLVAIALPILEACTAAAIVPRATAWYAALGALVLLSVFTAVIVTALLRGNRTACHCFGQLSTQPIGWSTLFRNGLFIAAAALIVVVGRGDPGPSTVAWIGALTPAERVSAGIAALALVATSALGWMLYEVSQGYGRVLLRLDQLEERVSAIAAAKQAGAQQPNTAPPRGLPIGTPLPAFALAALDGSRRTNSDIVDATRTALLVFMDPHCGPCTLMLPEITGWMAQHRETLSVWIISRGEPKPNRKKFGAYPPNQVLLLADLQFAQRLGTLPTPSAVLLRPDGRIGSTPAIGPDPIRALVSGMTAPTSNGLHIGSPAPAFRLRDLEGALVDSTKLGKRETLLLFWNPACTFCQKMLPDLLAWERKSDPAAPDLLLISTGSPDENRALGLTSRIVLDPGRFTVGQAYGCVGTPSAVLVDAGGLIASDVVVGAEAVLALAAPAARIRGST